MFTVFGIGALGLSVWGMFCTPRLQNALIKQYTLHHIRVPIIISGIFLNIGILESLGGFRFEYYAVGFRLQGLGGVKGLRLLIGQRRRFHTLASPCEHRHFRGGSYPAQNDLTYETLNSKP